MSRPTSYIEINAKTYEELVRGSSVFCDKTLFIKELFQRRQYQKILLTLPQGMGKSIILTMLQKFCEKSNNEAQMRSNRALFESADEQ